MVVEPVKSRPVADIAGQVGEHDTGPWRFIRRYVDEVRPCGGYTGVEAIGVDGTGRRGRRCITVVADPAEHDVIRVVPGKDSATVKRFATDPQPEVKRDPAKRRSKTAGACGMRECLRDILAYFDHRCANAIFEGLNGIIQHVETRSRGFGNMDCSSTMIYLTRGRPGLNTVTA